jgi:hypothetical protein
MEEPEEPEEPVEPPGPAASKHPEPVEVAVRLREERTYGPGDFIPGVSIIMDKNNHNINLIWNVNPDDEIIIDNIDDIQPGYIYIDVHGTQYEIIRTDANRHTITVYIPGSSRSVSPPPQAATVSRGGVKKHRVYKHRTYKFRTKKRRTQKRRARK